MQKQEGENKLSLESSTNAHQYSILFLKLKNKRKTKSTKHINVAYLPNTTVQAFFSSYTQLIMNHKWDR